MIIHIYMMYKRHSKREAGRERERREERKERKKRRAKSEREAEREREERGKKRRKEKKGREDSDLTVTVRVDISSRTESHRGLQSLTEFYRTRRSPKDPYRATQTTTELHGTLRNPVYMYPCGALWNLTGASQNPTEPY